MAYDDSLDKPIPAGETRIYGEYGPKRLCYAPEDHHPFVDGGEIPEYDDGDRDRRTLLAIVDAAQELDALIDFKMVIGHIPNSSAFLPTPEYEAAARKLREKLTALPVPEEAPLQVPGLQRCSHDPKHTSTWKCDDYVRLDLPST